MGQNDWWLLRKRPELREILDNIFRLPFNSSRQMIPLPTTIGFPLEVKIVATDKQDAANKALAAGLVKARTAKSEKPLFFALLLKGGSDGELLVDNKKIPPAKIQEAKTRSGGSTVVNGVCFNEEGTIVFEVPKPPAGTWAAAAKKMAQAAGVSIKAEFRQGRDPDSVSESSTETEEAEVSEDTAADTAAAEWAQRFKVVGPKLMAALKANNGDVTKLQTVFAFVKEKANAKDYAKALTGLDTIEKLLQATGGTTTPPPKDEAGKDAGLATWQKARETAVASLRGVAAKVAATKDPDAGPVIIVLQSIIKNLTASPATPQQVNELEKYLRDDDVITAAEEVPSEYGTLHIRKPLLEALATLKS